MSVFAVWFENYSIKLSTAGVQKSQETLLWTVANNTCGWLLSVETTPHWYTGRDNYDEPYIVV